MRVRPGYLERIKARIRQLGGVLFFSSFRVVAFNIVSDVYLVALGGDEDDDEEFYVVSRDAVWRVDVFGGAPAHFEERLHPPHWDMRDAEQRFFMKRLEELYSYCGVTVLIISVREREFGRRYARVVPVGDLGVAYMFVVGDGGLGRSPLLLSI